MRNSVVGAVGEHVIKEAPLIHAARHADIWLLITVSQANMATTAQNTSHFRSGA